MKTCLEWSRVGQPSELSLDLQVHGVIEESYSCWAVKSFTVGGSATHRPLPWYLRHTHSWGQGILLTKASVGGNHPGMISQAALTMWSSGMLPPTFPLSFIPPGQTCIVLEDSPSLLLLPPYISPRHFPNKQFHG